MDRTNNPYDGRWKWWYAAIADWMIANPGRPLCDCAKDIGRAQNTVYLIAQTDLFKAHLAERRSEWEARHDTGLRQRLHAVAESSLDVLLDTIDKKRDTLGAEQLTTIATSALDRLGYSPQKSTPLGVQVNLPGSHQTMVVAPIDPAALEEARSAMRLAQSRRAAVPIESHTLPEHPLKEAGLLGSDVVDSAEALDDGPLVISSE
jgi:hypothetical protein